MEVRYLNWNDALSPTRAAAASSAATRQRHALGAADDDNEIAVTTHTEANAVHVNTDTVNTDTVNTDAVNTDAVPAHTHAAKGTVPAVPENNKDTSLPPAVPPSDQFDVVLATDVLYEADMAFGVAAAVKRHLAPHGRCVILNAVRFPVCVERGSVVCVCKEGSVCM